jgi:hypothetical protein
MAVHRAWRLVIENTNGGGSTRIRELEMRDVSGGPDLATSGNAIWSGVNSGSPTATGDKAFDNSLATDWISESNGANSTKWVGQDFGSNPANWKDIAEIVITASATVGDGPRHMRLEWTDDAPNFLARWNRDWMVWNQTGWTTNQVRTFTRPAKTSQLYWRIRGVVGGGNPVMALTEIEFRDTLGGPQIATGGTAISSGNFDATTPPSEAFDGITTGVNFWASPNPGYPGAWVGYQHPAPVTVVQAKLWGRADAEPGQSPQRFGLDASADGITWVQVWEWYYLTWAVGTSWVVTPPEDDEITIPKIAAGMLVGGEESAERITKVSGQLLAGGWPNKITDAKISGQLLAGGWPNRITTSKVSVQFLINYIPRSVNGPVQIIGG